MTFITRAKRNLAYSVHQVLLRSARIHDRLVWIGKGEDRQLVRLVEVLYHGNGIASQDSCGPPSLGSAR